MSAVAGVAAVALCHAGLSGLCLTMGRHQQQVWQCPLSPIATQGMRAGGWVLLIVSLAICLRQWDLSVGPVVWFGLLSLAAASVVLLLSYAPRLLSRCLAAAASLGIVLFLLSI